MEIKVMENIFGANDKKAGEVREMLSERRVLMVNLIGSPGAGKTTVLERTIESLCRKYKMAVIEGDVATDRDARRLQRFDIPIILINTDGACHLEALGIEQAVLSLDLDSTDVIFIENVGNMVCPAEFDVGEHAKIAVISTTEGDDKPAKYPLLFMEASAVLLNKTDLIPYTNFRKEFFYEDVRGINSDVPVFELSSAGSESPDEWLDWLSSRIDLMKK